MCGEAVRQRQGEQRQPAEERALSSVPEQMALQRHRAQHPQTCQEQSTQETPGQPQRLKQMALQHGEAEAEAESH